MKEVSTPVLPGTLGVHVLSSKLGESIVVTLPDGKWFVVDAFSGHRVRGARKDNRSHAVLAFLDRFSLKAEDCAFVLLTHLHLDHYEGIPQLLKELRKRCPKIELFRHGAYRRAGVLERIGEHLEAEYLDLPRAQKELFVGPRAREIAQLFPERCRDIGQWSLVYSRPDFECYALVIAPGDEIVNRYMVRSVLSDNLLKLRSERPQAARGLLKSQNTILNDMSSALCVMFGETCILLSGDCEVEAWKSLEGNSIPPATLGLQVSDPLSSIHFLKVPHHGSSRAWNPFLEGLYRPGVEAVVTHHQKGSFHLPDLEGLERIRRRGTGVAVINKTWLPEEVQQELEELPGFKAIPLPNGRKGSAQQAERIRARYGGNVRSVEEEISWISTSFGDGGRSSGQWFGGSHAGFLPPRG